MPRRGSPAAAVAVAVIALPFALASGCASDEPSAANTPSASAKLDRAKTGAGDPVVSGKVTVAMSDFKFEPGGLQTRAGDLKVTAKNTGEQPHEFVVIRTDRAPDKLPMKGGAASEAGAVGEIGEQQPGRSASHTFSLKPGRYIFICNVPGHYTAGMRGSLTVR